MMQEQDLPTPVAPDSPISPNPEAVISASGEIINTPVASGPERVVSAGDRVNQGAPTQQVSLPTDLPQPISVAKATDTTTSVSNQSSLTSSPPVADDVDVIEKVWVQKAKSIVDETKSDPYRQEEKVSELQTDYQLKRFGEAASDK